MKLKVVIDKGDKGEKIDMQDTIKLITEIIISLGLTLATDQTIDVLKRYGCNVKIEEKQ
jgi:hypothetical protein